MLVNMKIKTKVRGGPTLANWRRPAWSPPGTLDERGGGSHRSST